MKSQAKRLFRLREVAKITGVSYKSLTCWCRQGRIRHAITAGGGVYVMTQDMIDDLLHQFEEATHEPAAATA